MWELGWVTFRAGWVCRKYGVVRGTRWLIVAVLIIAAGAAFRILVVAALGARNKVRQVAETFLPVTGIAMVPGPVCLALCVFSVIRRCGVAPGTSGAHRSVRAAWTTS